MNFIANLIGFGILGYILFKIFKYFGKRTVNKMASKTLNRFENGRGAGREKGVVPVGGGTIKKKKKKSSCYSNT
ncbi:hypothetical protein CSC81_16695 [Tenacibaculum discolor]|uniref:Uncharacterized protein n=1 Tax=Tenacibaculum discolor TaxID=361581 RepID=A0A2G1BPU2_9FLAO|nr:hypothetical protein CSC81_16695 [Tenacibaculum discolor]